MLTYKPCVGRWETGEWTSCSATCGVGLMTRAVACTQQPSRDSNRTLVLRDEDCQTPKPGPVQACNRFDCPPLWDTQDWGQVKDLREEAPPTHLCETPPDLFVSVTVVLPQLRGWSSAAAGPVQTAAGGWERPGSPGHLLPL